MGFYVLKQKNTEEQVEVYYNELGVIEKIIIYSQILNRDVELDLENFKSENPHKFTKLQTRAHEELSAEKQFSEDISDEEFEPNPAA
jgi:hypothetical protein